MLERGSLYQNFESQLDGNGASGISEGFDPSIERVALNHNQAMKFILSDIQDRGVQMIALEPPPMYAAPDPRHPVQAYTNPAFQGGLYFTDSLEKAISNGCALDTNFPVQDMRVYLMVDDVTNVSEVQENVFNRTLAKIDQATHGNIALLHHGNQDTVFLESALNAQAGTGKPGEADALLQYKKLLTLLEKSKYIGHPQDPFVPRSAIYIVHPLEFGSQQNNTLGLMLKRMKADSSPELKSLSKEQRRELLTRMIRHVWIDQHGEIACITQPVYDGNTFRMRDLWFPRGANKGKPLIV